MKTFIVEIDNWHHDGDVSDILKDIILDGSPHLSQESVRVKETTSLYVFYARLPGDRIEYGTIRAQSLYDCRTKLRARYPHANTLGFCLISEIEVR